MLLKNYMINEKTILLTGVYGHRGRLQTLVIETDKTFRVNGTAEKILNFTLKQRGTSFRGALDNAKESLGNLKMYPIKMDAQLGLYMFPSKSPKRPDCVWFSLIHVKEAKALGKNKIQVYFSHDHSIIIDCTLSSFNNKLQRALELRRIIAEKENSPITFYLEPKCDTQVDKLTDPSLLNDDQKDISSGPNDN